MSFSRFRIYYNQAYPDGLGRLCLVSWYDGDNLGLSKEPLLPSAKSVYSNLQGRVFRVPVFHVSRIFLKKSNYIYTLLYFSLLPGFGLIMIMIPLPTILWNLIYRTIVLLPRR